jgi:hypothetical protein
MQTLQDLSIREATLEKVAPSREMEEYLTSDSPGLAANIKLVRSGGLQLPAKVQIAEWIGELQATV